MSFSFRRTSVAAGLAALALAIGGLPATAVTPSAPVPGQSTPTMATAAAADYTVEKTGGLTELSEQNPAGGAGAIFDSRKPSGTSVSNLLTPQRTISFPLAVGGLSVPADATAVILNVTAIAPTRPGWLTVWPSDRTRPAASTLNFAPGTPTPNLAVVPITASRTLKVMNGSSGSTQVLVAFEGWVRSNGGVQRPGSLTPTTGTRVLDTRAAGPAVPAQGYRDVTVGGHGVPVGASAALLDVVAVKPTRAGYLVAHPSDTARPTSTALTYRVGTDRAALTLTKLSATGKVRVWNMSSAPVHLVVDSFGWVMGGDSSATPAGTTAITPQRVLDERVGVGSRREIPLPAGVQGTASGVVLAITATGSTTSSHLQVGLNAWDLNAPLALSPSLLNFAPGETVTNTAYLPVPSRGPLVVSVNSGTARVVVDVVGIIRPQVQFDGRVVTEADGQPVNPGRVDNNPSTVGSTPTRGDGTFSHTVPFAGVPRPLCASVTSDTGTPDPAWARGCLGGSVVRTLLPTETGSKVIVGDLRVARVGTASGRVTSPTGTSPAGSLAVLHRTDNAYLVTADVAANGTWQMPAVPVGTYVAYVRGPSAALVGEALDEVPLITTGITSHQERLTLLLGSTATRYVVTANSATAVGDAQLLAPGTLNGVVVDPDGSLADVTVEWRHTSGYLLASGPAGTTPMTHTLRPGGWVLCATEAAVTRCSGGASSFAGATPVVVASGATVTSTVTLP
jgi:hypothetical protein